MAQEIRKLYFIIIIFLFVYNICKIAWHKTDNGAETDLVGGLGGVQFNITAGGGVCFILYYNTFYICYLVQFLFCIIINTKIIYFNLF